MRFVEEAEVVLFTGPPGVGKPHLAIGLGLEAIRAGYLVYLNTLSELADQVPRDRADPKWAEWLRVLSHPRLLIRRRGGVRAFRSSGLLLRFLSGMP